MLPFEWDLSQNTDGASQGIAIFVIAGVFLGIYLYNRHRRRLPSKRSIVDNLPSLSFSRAPNDPYAEPIPGLDTDPHNPHPPGASRFGFGRPVYTRQRSSEWELPLEHRPGGGKGKGKARDWGSVEMPRMPSEPDEAAFPLRSRSPRPVSPRVWSDGPSGRGTGSARSLSPRVTPTLGQAGVNPFEPEMGGSGHAEESNKLMPGERYLRAVGSDDGTLGDSSTITSGSTEELESSVEVEGIREGTRFVERFGSREG